MRNSIPILRHQFVGTALVRPFFQRQITDICCAADLQSSHLHLISPSWLLSFQNRIFFFIIAAGVQSDRSWKNKLSPSITPQTCHQILCHPQSKKTTQPLSFKFAHHFQKANHQLYNRSSMNSSWTPKEMLTTFWAKAPHPSNIPFINFTFPLSKLRFVRLEWSTNGSRRAKKFYKQHVIPLLSPNMPTKIFWYDLGHSILVIANETSNVPDQPKLSAFGVVQVSLLDEGLFGGQVLYYTVYSNLKAITHQAH